MIDQDDSYYPKQENLALFLKMKMELLLLQFLYLIKMEPIGGLRGKNNMSCIHLIKVDKTPWHGDVFDHPIYEFYCSYTPGDNIKLPHQYICKNCKYFERDLKNDYLRGN